MKDTIKQIGIGIMTAAILISLSVTSAAIGYHWQDQHRIELAQMEIVKK